MAEIKITKEQINTLMQHFVEKQGLKIKSQENAGGCEVFRIASKNGAVISSVTIPPSLLDMPVSDAQKYVSALVMDMCRASAAEPAGRA